MENEDWTVVHMSNALAANKTTIEALVDALEAATRYVPARRGATESVSATYTKIDAALALARKISP